MPQKKTYLYNINSILQPVWCFRMAKLMCMGIKGYIRTLFVCCFCTYFYPLCQCRLCELRVFAAYPWIEQVCIRVRRAIVKSTQIYFDVSDHLGKKICSSDFSPFPYLIQKGVLPDKVQMTDFYGADFFQRSRCSIQKVKVYKIPFSCFCRYIRYCEHGCYRITRKTGYFLFGTFLTFYFLRFLI